MGLINNIGAWFEKLVDGWTFGSQDYKMTFKGNATIEGSGGGFEHTFPPKSGTVALLDDIAGGSISLGSILGLYKVDTNTTPPPASGDIKYDNSTQISATNLYIHNLTDSGLDINKALALISEGSVIYIQRSSVNTDYQLWEVTGTPSYSAPYFTFPVTLVNSGGEGTTNFQNNREVILGLINAGGGGGHIIENYGSPLTQRPTLNILNGLTASDDSINSKTLLKLGGTLTDDFTEISRSVDDFSEFFISLEHPTSNTESEFDVYSDDDYGYIFLQTAAGVSDRRVALNLDTSSGFDLLSDENSGITQKHRLLMNPTQGVLLESSLDGTGASLPIIIKSLDTSDPTSEVSLNLDASAQQLVLIAPYMEGTTQFGYYHTDTGGGGIGFKSEDGGGITLNAEGTTGQDQILLRTIQTGGAFPTLSFGLPNVSSASSARLDLNRGTLSNNTTETILTLIKSLQNGTQGANGIGVKLAFNAKNAETNVSTTPDAGIAYTLTDVTIDSEDSKYVFSLLKAGVETNIVELLGNGFYYLADHSSGATSRWIPDKGYVDTVVTGGNALQATFDGMGAVVLVNSIAYLRARTAKTIIGYSIVAEGTSPTCTVDILKIASGTTLPTVSITASATPQLTTGNAIKSTTLTGWTTAIDADDILAFKVTACSNATKIVIQLYVN